MKQETEQKYSILIERLRENSVSPNVVA